LCESCCTLSIDLSIQLKATYAINRTTERVTVDVSARADLAGNIGRTTNTIEIALVTNAAYGYTDAGCVSNISYTGVGVSQTLDFDWDGHYRLKSVITNGVLAESYEYNAHGLRVSTTEADGAKRWHVYNGNHPIAEVSTNGALLKSYTWGQGVDNLISFTEYTSSETNTYYTLTDHLGTVHAVADESGAIVESYDYDPWGRVLGVYDADGSQLSESAIDNHYLFQGRWYSWATDLYYFRARWYDPTSGRWLSKDPISISGGLNQYVAFGNNPVNLRDWSGLCTEEEKILSNIRIFIQAEENAARKTWWAPDWFVKSLGAIALHGGHPWSPLDVNVNAPNQRWTIDGLTMTSAQFGNYLAGYYAGCSGSQGVLAGMYAGGIGWALAGNIFTLGNYGESFTDAESAAYISAGFIAGSQARNGTH
jgi:RHS repeat-associated protein